MTEKLAQRINFSIAPVSEVQEISPIISKARVRIFYTGLNRNLTYITEEFAEKLLKTLPYTPVGGIWQSEEEDFSDHGGPGQDNRERFQAFGVVPENPNVCWEDHLDDDGVLRRYACCDVFLWTARYKAAREIPKKAQSMELYVNSIDGQWKRDGAVEYFEFTDGVFYGLLALGDDVDPCFEGAAFYGLDNSAKEFFRELKNYTLSANSELIGGTEMNEEVKVEDTPVVENEVVEETVEEAAAEEATEEVVEEVATEETEEATEETADENAVENFEEVVEDEHNEEVEEIEENEPAEDEESEEEAEVVEEESEEVSEEEEKDTYEALVQKVSDLESQVAEKDAQIENYQSQISELTSYKVEAERSKKTSLIEKYSILLDTEVCENYTAKIDEYSFEDLKKEISEKVLECNEEALFSKGESKEVVIDVNMTRNYTGAARLMSKYFKD